jgi:thioredoxin-like negative regulator of GroEL
MNDEILDNLPVLLPAHKYPLWLKLFAGGVLLATLYSLILLPKYLNAVKNLHAAKAAYQSGDYKKAIDFYVKVLETAYSSKNIRISTTEAFFAMGDKEHCEAGLALLDGIIIDDATWKELSKKIPIEYHQYFKDVNK